MFGYDWQDECSFVSLRDVERAMLVFIYFIEKMDLLRDAIDKKERNEQEVQITHVSYVCETCLQYLFYVLCNI